MLAAMDFALTKTLLHLTHYTQTTAWRACKPWPETRQSLLKIVTVSEGCVSEIICLRCIYLLFDSCLEQTFGGFQIINLLLIDVLLASAIKSVPT